MDPDTRYKLQRNTVHAISAKFRISSKLNNILKIGFKDFCFTSSSLAKKSELLAALVVWIQLLCLALFNGKRVCFAVVQVLLSLA